MLIWSEEAVRGSSLMCVENPAGPHEYGIKSMVSKEDRKEPY